VELEGTWRGGGHVIAGAAVSRTTAQLPGGGFTAVLASGRIEYDFNPRASFLGFVQYNNEAQRVDFNLRFHWIPQIGDDVFPSGTRGTRPITRRRIGSPRRDRSANP